MDAPRSMGEESSGLSDLPIERGSARVTKTDNMSAMRTRLHYHGRARGKDGARTSLLNKGASICGTREHASSEGHFCAPPRFWLRASHQERLAEARWKRWWS